jgi:hypothetical protein
VTLSATIGSNLPLHGTTGTVTFFNGSIALGGVKVSKSGTAVFVTSKLPPGVNNLTASYSGDPVLTPSVSTALAEIVSDYILQVIPATVAVKQGSSASVTLNLIPQGGFTNPVRLACLNLPSDVTCKFSNSTVNLKGINPVTTSLTLKVSKAAAASQKPIAITVKAISVAGTTPKNAALALTIKK